MRFLRRLLSAMQESRRQEADRIRKFGFWYY